MTIQELAAEARSYFELYERKENETIWVLKDGRPDWIQRLAYTAHGDMLPDDTRFDYIVAALDAIEEAEDLDEIQVEADIYTHDLTAWIHSRVDRYAYCDEALEEYGPCDPKDGSSPMITLLIWGQVKEREEVLSSVRQSLEERLEEVGEVA
jgi:hypothetical protein